VALELPAGMEAAEMARQLRECSGAPFTTAGIMLNAAVVLGVAMAPDDGATASEVLNYLSRQFGMTVRPNHLGMALQRHRRVPRLRVAVDAFATRNIDALLLTPP